MKEVQNNGVDFHSVMLLRGETLDDDVNLPDIEKLNILAKEMFEILGRYNYGVGGNSARILRNYHRYLWKTYKIIEEKDKLFLVSLEKVIWLSGVMGLFLHVKCFQLWVI